MEITKEIYDSYLNTGGFDMLGSARVKIETPTQIDTCIKNLTRENVDALVTIGGDDSNTNAAILAEHFLARKVPIQVIGVPKTIDGDLKNKYVEQSFGFDTATSIYASQIGNICRDAKSSRKYWHIIKLMGRDTGHICLECALQTHPNIAIIGEEVKAKKTPLATVVHHICDGIIFRSQKKENFGVVLFSEGIVENCIEVNQLLQDIDEVKTKFAADYRKLLTDKEKEDFILTKLADKKESQSLYASLPTRLKGQFMIDKDAHGHFQCALIDSEQLLIHLIKRELNARGHKIFNPIHHSFGYEGRCGWPTKFDANYTYALGITAMLLIANGVTGYLSCVRNLAESSKNWVPAGVPLSILMNPVGKPRIKAILVDLNGEPFKEYHRLRDTWKSHSDYLYPLPPHLYGPEEIIDKRTKTIVLEHKH
jgi:pyrophosphate--fructose-6-phosphate 1-phosphotransferase